MTRLPCLLALALAGAMAAAPARASDPAECHKVRFADIGWTDIQATTALARTVLDGLGYSTEAPLLSIPIAYASLKSGDIDVFLGDWQPSLAADRQPYLDDGSVEVLAVNLEGAKYTLAVPAYLAAQGLTGFADIARFRAALGGRLLGIEPGNDGNRIIESLIKDNHFDLGDFRLMESSEQAMITQVDRHYRRGEAVVFLAWAPHPMNARFDIAYLSGGDDWFGPDYGGATVHTDIRAGLADECPNLGRFLRQLRFTLEMENAIMGRILDENADPEAAARDWLVANPAVLEDWLDGVAATSGAKGLPAVRGALGL